MQFGSEVWRKLTIAAILMIVGTVLSASFFYKSIITVVKIN